MPRSKAKGTLDRSAAADLFRNTLAHIETTYGRLVYLAALRDTNTGVYRHHGLSILFGRDASVQAIRTSHEDAFEEWNRLPLETKYQDLKDYLTSLEDSRTAFAHWRQSKVYLAYIPASATEAERGLFSSDLEALLEAMIPLEAGVGGELDPNS